MRLCSALAVAALTVCLATPLSAAESLAIRLVEPDEDFLEAVAVKVSPDDYAKAERYRVVGIFNDARFSVESIDQMTVTVPGEKSLPLEVERASVIKEFGKIVSVRLAFEIDKATASKAGNRLVLEWGEDVHGKNTLVEKTTKELRKETVYMSFLWQGGTDAGGQDGGDSFASIEVIAESGAEYYYLWYLLPMGLIFLLLTIRKIFAV